MHNRRGDSSQYSKFVRWIGCDGDICRREENFQRFEVERHCPFWTCCGQLAVLLTRQNARFRKVLFVDGWFEKNVARNTASGRHCQWSVLHKQWASYSIDCTSRRSLVSLYFYSATEICSVCETSVCHPEEEEPRCIWPRKRSFKLFVGLFRLFGRWPAIDICMMDKQRVAKCAKNRLVWGVHLDAKWLGS